MGRPLCGRLRRRSSFGEQALALGDEASGQKFLAHGLVLRSVQQHLKRDAVEAVG